MSWSKFAWKMKSALLESKVMYEVDSPWGSPSGIAPSGELGATVRVLLEVPVSVLLPAARVMDRVVGRGCTGTGILEGVRTGAWALVLTRVRSLAALGDSSSCWLADG